MADNFESENVDDIIVTVRDDEVVKRIDKFIADHELEPRIRDSIFEIIYKVCWPFPQFTPRTHKLLFEEKLVNEGFKLIDPSKCPKAQKPPVSENTQVNEETPPVSENTQINESNKE